MTPDGVNVGLAGLPDAILTAEGGLSAIKSDPLAWFRFSSSGQRRFAQSLDAAEVYARCGNQAGKTKVGAYCAVALARGVKELDGVPLPMLPVPNVGAILVESYKQASESSLAMVKEAIGDWPHKYETEGQGVITAIRIMPDSLRGKKAADLKDVNGWSRILVLPTTGSFPAGIRLDWAWADEPPKEAYWRELRARGKANRQFVRYITATPLDRRSWEWLRREYTPGRYEGGVLDGKIEVRWNVFDNEALSKEHKLALEESYAKDPLREARLLGDYIDTTGACPFDSSGLARWERRCREGRQWHRESSVMVWHDHEAGDECFVIADPSAGIWDGVGEHDPACIVVISRLHRRVCARWNGYEQAHKVGRLARMLAEEYGGAMVVHERNSGYGESFVLGLGDYGNVYIEHHHDTRKGNLSSRIGWATTATTRGVIIGALQKAILEDGLLVESREAVESLRDVVLDPMGRIAAAPGRHDEDMIVLGLGAHLLETMPLYARSRTAEERVMEAAGVRGFVSRYDISGYEGDYNDL